MTACPHQTYVDGRRMVCELRAHDRDTPHVLWAAAGRPPTNREGAEHG